MLEIIAREEPGEEDREVCVTVSFLVTPQIILSDEITVISVS